MSPRVLLAEAAERLRAAGVASPTADAEWLLAHVLGVDRLRLGLSAEITPEHAEAFTELVRRRCERVPLQHLTGSAAFRRLDLAVGPGVFVPRPETELLAGWAIERAAALTAPVVVDLGTGSGAIAAAIADEVPRARVHAVELDEKALAWAERNLAGTGVELRHGDLAEAFADLDATVDVVVSNPPYIPLAAWESVEPEVRDHDPAAALWSGQDGLDAIAAVERTAARLLRDGGAVAVEHAAAQGESAPAVFGATGRWVQIADHADLTGRPRFVTAQRAEGRTAQRAERPTASRMAR